MSNKLPVMEERYRLFQLFRVHRATTNLKNLKTHSKFPTDLIPVNLPLQPKK